MSPGGASPARYARSIEAHWARRQERPVVLSPRDWSLIETWHERGVPLELVLEALDAAIERGRKRSGGPRSLGYIAGAVEEAWSVIREGRLPRESGGVRLGVQPSPVDAWRRRLEREGTDSALGKLLAELVERLDAGIDSAEIDAALESRLHDSVPQSLRELVDREIASELAPYLDRMAPEVLEATRRTGRIRLLRRKLDLPRLHTASATPRDNAGASDGEPG